MQARLEKQQEQQSRPVGINIVSGFQIFKAAVLLGVAFLLRSELDMLVQWSKPLYPLLYVAMRGNTPAIHAILQGGTASEALSTIMLLIGLYIGATAIGLFLLHPWARRSMLFASGLTLLLYAKSTLFPEAQIPGGSQALTDPNMLYVHLLIALEALFFVYLSRSNTADVFNGVSNNFPAPEPSF